MLFDRSAETSTQASVAGKGIFAKDFKEKPYWYMAAAPDESLGAPIPLDGARAEVAIVGSGITGLVAGIRLARGGADVLILDGGVIGGGAVRMNAGFLGRTLKRSVGWLEKHHGTDYAMGVYHELDAALQGVTRMVAEEGIDCYRRTSGRYIAANSQAHLTALIADLEEMKQKLGFDYQVIPKADQHTELASDRYVGGAVLPDLGSIHPGLYHKGLVERAIAAGVRFQSQTPVTGITDEGGQKAVHTTRGTLLAKHVVVATNGYTRKGLSWYARRLVPFRGYVLATEVLPSELLDKVLPNRRTYLDTKMNIDFMRPAPDSERILFGGMTGGLTPTATGRAPALYKRMVQIMPDLAGVKISRAWTGFCAGSYDFMPHMGTHEGVHYAMGYNFAGVPIGTMFGDRIAARILGHNDTATVFDTGKFPHIPLLTATGMVAPLAMRYFDWHDRQIAKRA